MVVVMVVENEEISGRAEVVVRASKMEKERWLTVGQVKI